MSASLPPSTNNAASYIRPRPLSQVVLQDDSTQDFLVARSRYERAEAPRRKLFLRRRAAAVEGDSEWPRTTEPLPALRPPNPPVAPPLPPPLSSLLPFTGMAEAEARAEGAERANEQD